MILALLGGICSLFLGCSFVTPLEFIYFVTVRLPSFWKGEKCVGDPCPSSPTALRGTVFSASDRKEKFKERDERFPSVRHQNSSISTILNKGAPNSYYQPRNERFPSVRQQNSRFIKVLPPDSTIWNLTEQNSRAIKSICRLLLLKLKVKVLRISCIRPFNGSVNLVLYFIMVRAYAAQLFIIK